MAKTEKKHRNGADYMTINIKLGTYPKLNRRRWRCKCSIQ